MAAAATAENFTYTVLRPTAETNDSSNVNDAAFDKTTRIVFLYVAVILGLVGCACVGLWLWSYGRRKSRITMLIMHVTVSDLCVLCIALLPQLVWENMDREWVAGWVACKLLKFAQSLVFIASNYMLIVLSADRYHAIAFPLRNPPAVWQMVLVGWLAAVILSLPQFAVFHLNHIPRDSFGGHADISTNDTTNSSLHMPVCESIFRTTDKRYRQMYLTYVGVVVFFIPCIVLWVCYLSIYVIIRAHASAGSTSSRKSGKIQLQSMAANSWPRAKIKTMKMAIVIGMAFTIFGMPYHVLEMIYSYGDHKKVHPVLAAIFGGMAVANSAMNPYVFLLFNATSKCVQHVLGPCARCLTCVTVDKHDDDTMMTGRRRLRDSTFSTGRTTDFSVASTFGRNTVRPPSPASGPYR